MNKRLIVAALGAAALAVPAAAAADQGHGRGHGRGHDKPAVAKKAKRVTFVFKGSFVGEGTVQVVSGNAQARKGGFVGQTLTFDFAGARVVVADTNGDHKADVTDVKAGDRVVVKARLAKGTKYGADLVATNLIDTSNAPRDEVEPGDDD